MLTIAGRPLERSNDVHNGWFMMRQLQHLMQRQREAHDATRVKARQNAACKFVDAAIAKSGQATSPPEQRPWSAHSNLPCATTTPNQHRRGRHGKPIPESRPARRAFNTPNAAGVSRDTDAGPN